MKNLISLKWCWSFSNDYGWQSSTNKTVNILSLFLVSHCSDGEVPRPSLTLNGCSEDALELIMRARQRRSHSELLCGSELLIPNRLNHVQHYHSDHLHPQSSVGCEMKKQNLRYTRSCNNNIPIITLRTDDSDEKTETWYDAIKDTIISYYKLIQFERNPCDEISINEVRQKTANIIILLE